ncbi:ATP-binding protein [Alkalihalobacillus sp. AL-G]|uniref:ATP-binding protein n=1 Tax=Alkalihalobacillus sp. AL-G TaxID=2926399 RepID=UPI00272BAE41|nr:ATP-binding protein [Alkalihalobacillus sp. AL-G]WLD94376.1 ATP-binding protein [Alkalihalobacillus sp. AL-G]
MVKHTISINTENDIQIALHYVRKILNFLSFSDMDKQKVIVSVSELTQNILDHANHNGLFICESIDNQAIQITVKDNGQGIDNLEQILDGYEPQKPKGLGLGLAGAKRLMDDFAVESTKGGTTIVAIKRRTEIRNRKQRTFF